MRDEEVIDALRTLRPSPSQATAVAAAFEAGRRDGRRAARPWRLSSATLGAALLVVLFSSLRTNQKAESQASAPGRIDSVTLATSLPQSTAASDLPAAFMLTRQAIDHGIDALPRPRSKESLHSQPTLVPPDSERVFNRGDL